MKRGKSSSIPLCPEHTRVFTDETAKQLHGVQGESAKALENDECCSFVSIAISVYLGPNSS